MWMETIVLRGTLSSSSQATKEIAAIIDELSIGDDGLDMLNVYHRHPEFGDLLVEIRWKSVGFPPCSFCHEPPALLHFQG